MEPPAKKSKGTLCRWLKIGIGTVLLALGIFVVEGTLGIILIILGACILLCGIIGYCPCYALCSKEGERTCCLSRKKDKNGCC